MWMWLGLVGIEFVVRFMVAADSRTQPKRLTTQPQHLTTPPSSFTMPHQALVPVSRKPTPLSEVTVHDISGHSDIYEGNEERLLTVTAMNVNISDMVVENESIDQGAYNTTGQISSEGEILANVTEQDRKTEIIAEESVGDGDWEEKQDWQECGHLALSPLVQEGFRHAVALGDEKCARLWCSHVEGSEERHFLGGVYYVVQLGYVAEDEHECLLNITKMVVLHHSWPMCSSDFVCATNHSTFGMSAADCMPWSCRVAETMVLVFMVLVSVCITVMSITIMVVIVSCPQFHKPKYYLRFSLATTDLLIGVIVCGHAAYNQWVGLTEVPFGRFLFYANLKAGQLFRHVPNCLWGVSDVLTQISGFFVTANMITSLYTLSLMSLDRYLLLTRTHYRSLVTSSRVSAAIMCSWCCGLVVPSLHFVYRPQKQHDICINYDTSSLDVHIINNESKIATADYKVYLRHTVPLLVTFGVLGLPIVTLLVCSFRTLRRYKSYTRDYSVRQVKSALQLTHCALSRQASATSLSAMVSLGASLTPTHSKVNTNSSTPPYKLKLTFKKKKTEENGRLQSQEGCSSSLVRQTGDDEIPEHRFSQPLTRRDGATTAAVTGGTLPAEAKGGQPSCRDWVSGRLGLVGGRPRSASHPYSEHLASTIRRITGSVVGGGERLTVRERDREITCTVLVNIAVFVFACFPLLAVGGWMMFLYFTQQETLNNRAPLKQLLFVAPWLMALNSLWNAVLHLTYNHKFRSAASHMICSHCRRLWRGFCRRVLGRTRE